MSERPPKLIERAKSQFSQLWKKVRDAIDPVEPRGRSVIPELFNGYQGDIGVISLDSGSGQDFCESLRYILKMELGNSTNIARALDVKNVPPRVVYRRGSKKR